MEIRTRKIVKEVLSKPTRPNMHHFSDDKYRPANSPVDRDALDEFVQQEQHVRMQRIKWQRTKQNVFYITLKSIGVLILLYLFALWAFS